MLMMMMMMMGTVKTEEKLLDQKYKLIGKSS